MNLKSDWQHEVFYVNMLYRNDIMTIKGNSDS